MYQRACQITPNEKEIFLNEFLHKKPVVIKKFYANSNAVEKWCLDFFMQTCGHKKVKIHFGPTSQHQKKIMTVGEYLELLYKQDLRTENILDDSNQTYLYNFQLMKLGAELLEDLNLDPDYSIGKWYRKNWKRDLFFYCGNRHTLSRLHYDSLGTHNTFFQIYGRKKFILIPYFEKDKCYINYPKNTFSELNPETPDFKAFPLFKDVKPYEAILEAGDVLYMPPYTLHYVRGLDLNISINLDWHSTKSVTDAFTLNRVNGLLCHYWNFISFLGVVCHIPNDILYNLYKSQYR